MSYHRQTTTPELQQMHKRLVAEGLILHLTTPDGGSRIEFPQGFDHPELQRYRRLLNDRAQ